MNPMATRGAFLAAALLTWAHTAQAGRPLTTDDAGVLEARSCEWESYAAQLRNRGSDNARTSGWQTQVGCGFGHGAQASLSYAGSRASDDRAETVGMAGKFELLAGSDSRPAITATLGVNALRVIGSSFELKDHSAALVFTHGFAPGWTAHANLGVTHDRAAHQSSSLWNLALERAVHERVDVAAEVYGDDRGSRWMAGGLRWTPRPELSLNAAVGKGRDQRLVSIGGKLSF